ncbi:hypothetical protein WN51_02157 [Melipona quadrifasciata]|uniref:Uncharacterized protein n=1 Tax=Melipona quadrifasciata TaxID=166423 RepID=A0A0M8ZW03_9HYME|nr:hypothetical protein WN51_02157 [Melipona quadrifasciata]
MADVPGKDSEFEKRSNLKYTDNLTVHNSRYKGKEEPNKQAEAPRFAERNGWQYCLTEIENSLVGQDKLTRLMSNAADQSINKKEIFDFSARLVAMHATCKLETRIELETEKRKSDTKDPLVGPPRTCEIPTRNKVTNHCRMVNGELDKPLYPEHSTKKIIVKQFKKLPTLENFTRNEAEPEELKMLKYLMKEISNRKICSRVRRGRNADAISTSSLTQAYHKIKTVTTLKQNIITDTGSTDTPYTCARAQKSCSDTTGCDNVPAPLMHREAARCVEYNHPLCHIFATILNCQKSFDDWKMRDTPNTHLAKSVSTSFQHLLYQMKFGIVLPTMSKTNSITAKIMFLLVNSLVDKLKIHACRSLFLSYLSTFVPIALFSQSAGQRATCYAPYPDTVTLPVQTVRYCDYLRADPAAQATRINVDIDGTNENFLGYCTDACASDIVQTHKNPQLKTKVATFLFLGQMYEKIRSFQKPENATKSRARACMYNSYDKLRKEKDLFSPVSYDKLYKRKISILKTTVGLVTKKEKKNVSLSIKFKFARFCEIDNSQHLSEYSASVQ